MAANLVFLRRDDPAQPRAPPPPLPPRSFSATPWTTLLENPPSFSPPPDDSPSSSSWDPRSAFAEDACSLLCGSSWPPRSYSCSFCKREFKSAQALGGHMNVHRRDRARLRQTSPSASDPASLTLAPDLHHSDIPQATDQLGMSFPYSSPNDSAFSGSLAPSFSLWHSSPPSKPSFMSPPKVGAASSLSLHRASFEHLPPDDSNLPGFPSRSSSSTSQFALQSLNSLRPAFPVTGVAPFSDQGTCPAALVDTGKRYGVSTSLLHLKSESSRKKSVTSGGFQPYHTLSVKNNLESVNLPRLRSEDTENNNVAPDDLDLELRLGQKS